MRKSLLNSVEKEIHTLTRITFFRLVFAQTNYTMMNNFEFLVIASTLSRLSLEKVGFHLRKFTFFSRIFLDIQNSTILP